MLEYDGTRFAGWQVQPGQRTIQEELRKALETICGESLKNPLASGRTDAGVHARRQVVNVHLPSDAPPLTRIQHGVSNILKNEVSVVSAEVVSDDFHAVKNSVEKQYTYHIFHRPAPPTYDYGHVLHIASSLDIETMNREAASLIGEHDYTSFRASGCGAKHARREVFYSAFEYRNPHLVFTIRGNGFLKQMVRNIVGTLVAIGRGKMTKSIEEILKAEDRTLAGPTAPAHALFLDWVKYDDGFISNL